SWQMDRFKDASDIVEMRTLTRSTGSTLNTFQSTGKIVGALGQTDDLTPDVITQMLAIDPTMVNFFKAEQLAAMPDDVFAALPDEYIASLDGITRDALAAKALASAITGEDVASEAVNLPSAWKLQPPQLITFSFDDIPLANYSISGTAPAAAIDNSAETPAEAAAEPTPTPTEEATPVLENVPEGPALPEQFNLLGAFFGVTLDTAADLLTLNLPEAAAQQLGSTHPSPAQLFNALALLSNPQTLAALPLAQRLALGALDIGGVFGDLSPEAVEFIQQYDPTFLPSLSADVYDLLSDAVLALPEAAPPLDTVWDNLATQPQFGDMPLHSAKDILALGGGSATAVLNNINADVPERFAGYEVRLFNSLSTGTIRYFVVHEPDFFSKLDPAVLLKLSPEALALVPQDIIAALPDDTAAQLTAIASGEHESAAEELAARYATDVPPADPNAPPLAADWQTIGNFLSVELDSADDFFRFFPDTATFLNSFFDSAQGVAFAPNLFGSLTLDDLNYMVGRAPNLLNDLRIEALQLLSPDVVAGLPQDVQDRITSGATPFVPTDNVTRTNGNPSLVVTIYKTSDANNVEAFHIVDDALHAIAAENPSIQVNVAFEQASFVEESISGVAREGGLGAIFAVIVILVFLSSGTWSSHPRRIVGSVIVALFLVLLALYVISNANGGDLGAAFASSDVVVRALLIGGALAGLAILLYPGKLPYPSWRSTLVTGVSIPLSVLIAMTLMRWLPPAVHSVLVDSADTSPLIGFVLRLFPASITLNIMTLSGLTVAIGRVVDDSIVVLENIFRHVQEGGDKREAIIEGTRDVSVAIFAATVITVVVFLPLGLTGGIIGEIFLPFGLAVTYALLSSFVVAITVVPVMAYLLLDNREISGEHESWLERLYNPILRWTLASTGHRWVVLGVAVVSLVIGGVLFASRPQAFLPALGEPQIAVSVSLPASTKIADTNTLVKEFEDWAQTSINPDDIGTVQTTIGSGGDLESLILGGGGSVSENVAQITIGIHHQDKLDALTAEVRAKAQEIFGVENVTVSAASLSEQGFGGFALVLSGPQDELAAINDDVIATLNNVDGLTNVSSSLAQAGGGGDNAPTSFIRIDQQSALSFTGELETENTLGVTAAAKEAIRAMSNLPPDVVVSEGFQSAMQTEGFAGLGKAMAIAIVLVVIILIITFGSFVHWLDIILSIIVAPVGAAVLLTLTNRVLGISAMIGLLMLIGIVVTNAVVLIDRVQSNQRERGMNTHDALMEAGNRRLRPILMTALATIFALVPLAVGLSEGAIIASELGTVVIGGLFSSTLLTLIVVPVAYMMLDPLNRRLRRQRQNPPQA
ncbi:MAG: efflux RND transporter permease subunit, partial [Anaerolineae bacterium]|nr:efflux RND transporter permease subunit [Anaerolineae bacterium]